MLNKFEVASDGDVTLNGAKIGRFIEYVEGAGDLLNTALASPDITLRVEGDGTVHLPSGSKICKKCGESKLYAKTYGCPTARKDCPHEPVGQ